ncbi:MAG TPA: DNA polymerase III subunit delta [Gemmatimonadales bacterium]|nr:DNA polymerase III subunit delta [Gemmatimonadales bacterium]
MPALQFDEFLRQLKKGEVLPAYYFYGDEDLLKDDAVGDLLAAALDPSTRDFNLDRRRAADLTAEEFSSLALTPPMMAERRAVVVTEVEVLDQKRTRIQALRSAIVAWLTKPAPGTLLVLVQSGQTKSDPELVRLASSVCFDPLSPDRVMRWIRHRAGKEGLEIEPEAADHLRAVVGGDLAQLAAELAKLASAVRGRAATVADVSELAGVHRGETVHDFVDAVTSRELPRALEMVPHLMETPGTSGVRLIASLGTAFTALALARSLLDSGSSPSATSASLYRAFQSARPMGLRQWNAEAERWTRDARRWTAQELERALAVLLKTDRRLKSTTLGGETELVSDALLAIAEQSGRKVA